MSQQWIIVAAAALLAGIGNPALAQRRQAAAPQALPDGKIELMDADRAFAKATAERKLDGWMSFMAPDAVRIAPLGAKAHTGEAAIRKLDAAIFADPKQRLVWEPTDAGVFADGRHGFTTGRYRVLTQTEKGRQEATRTGAYVTCWRKGADGRWLVILDTGASDPPKH